jgi:hypothetical protein
MPRWRPGDFGGPSLLRALPSARLAHFSRPNCVFDGRRLELAVRAELMQGQEARAQPSARPETFTSQLQKLGLRLCAHPTFAPCNRQDPGPPLPPMPLPFARSLRRLALQTQQPPPQQQPSELLSALRGGGCLSSANDLWLLPLRDLFVCISRHRFVEI